MKAQLRPGGLAVIIGGLEDNIGREVSVVSHRGLFKFYPSGKELDAWLVSVPASDRPLVTRGSITGKPGVSFSGNIPTKCLLPIDDGDPDIEDERERTREDAL